MTGRECVAVAVLAAGILTTCGSDDTGPGIQSIKIGAVFDLTGATAGIGAPWSEGVRGYIEWVNQGGGIAGRQVELLFQDYGYRVDVAEQLYTQFVQEGVVAFIGWGTGDTEALRGRIAEDEIPFISASFSHVLGRPTEAPYNFVVGTSYTDQLKILLDWIVEHEGGRAPQEVAVMHLAGPAGISPIEQGGRDYAASLGIHLTAHEMSRGSTDFSAEVTRVAQSGARYVVFQHTSSAAALALKNARQLGLDLSFSCLNYCTNEILIELAGDAAEGVLGSVIFAPPGDRVEGSTDADAFLRARGSSLEQEGLLYGQGWAMTHILFEGIRRAAAGGGEVRGAAIREALESLRDFDMRGVTVPVTFTPRDHLGIKGMRIYEVRDGRWQPLTDLRFPADRGPGGG